MKKNRRRQERRGGRNFPYFGWQRLNLFFLPVFLFGSVLAATAASFTASLDRDTITLGEQATLSLTFEGGQPKSMCRRPACPDWKWLTQTGTSQNVDFVNGAMSSTIVIAYPVAAKRDGEYTIPALTADVNGQQLSTAPLKLTVLKAAAPSAAAMNSGSEVAFLKLSLPNQKIYVGQSVVGRLEVCLRNDVQNFGDFQLTCSPTDGFRAGKTTELQNQRRRAQIGNHIYTVIPLAVPLTAVRRPVRSRSVRSPPPPSSCCRRGTRAVIPFFGRNFSIRASKSRSRWRANRSPWNHCHCRKQTNPRTLPTPWVISQ